MSTQKFYAFTRGSAGIVAFSHRGYADAIPVLSTCRDSLRRYFRVHYSLDWQTRDVLRERIDSVYMFPTGQLTLPMRGVHGYVAEGRRVFITTAWHPLALADAEFKNYVVAHELAHAYLGHAVDANTCKDAALYVVHEREADALAAKWGYVTSKWHAENRERHLVEVESTGIVP